MEISSALSKINLDCKEFTIPVPWGVIACKCYGNSKNPHVLMIHGLLDNAGSFDRLMPFLPDLFYYVNIDLPGHGQSTKFPDGIFLEMMLYVSAIRRVVLHLQWTKYYIIGHSLGGQLGSYYTAVYQEEVIKLVIFDTLSQMIISKENYLNFYKEEIKNLIELEKKMASRGPPNYTPEEALRRAINNRPTFIKKEAAEVLIKRSLKESSTSKNFFHFSTDQRLKLGVTSPMSTEQHLHIISKIECPVLLVITHGYFNFVENRKDNYAHSTLKFFKNKSNIQIIRVDGDHDVHNNEPEVVGPLVSKFLLQTKSVL